MAGVVSQAGLDDQFSRVPCDACSAVTRGMDLPAQGAPSQRWHDCLTLTRVASWKDNSRGADNGRSE